MQLHFSLLFLLPFLFVFSASHPFKSFVPKHLRNQCGLVETSFPDCLLKPTNYLSYLLASYILVGQELSPKVLERNFQLAISQSNALKSSEGVQRDSLNIAIICPTSECQGKFSNYLDSEDVNDPKETPHRPTLVRVTVIVDFDSFKDTFQTVKTERTEVFVKKIRFEEFNWRYTWKPDPMTTKYTTLMEKLKDNLFLPEFFFDLFDSYYKFIYKLKEIQQNQTLAVTNSNWFSPRVLIPSREDYLDFVNLLADARKDVGPQELIGVRKNGTHFNGTSYQVYSETLQFMKMVQNPEEFIDLVVVGFIQRNLLQNRERVAAFHLEESLMGEGLFSKEHRKLRKKSVYLYYYGNTHFRYSSKYLTEKVFRSHETQSLFHREHWGRYMQFKESQMKRIGTKRQRNMAGAGKLKDVVLTFAVGIDMRERNIHLFFKTFREADNRTDLVVFVDGKDILDFSRILAGYNLTFLSYFDYGARAQKGNYSSYSHLGRFRVTCEFLKENNHYGRVFHTDLTDALFQSNIFDVLPEYNEFSNSFVYFNMEDVIDSREKFLSKYTDFHKGAHRKPRPASMLGLFGWVGMTSNFKWSRICAGTIAGDRISMIIMSLLVLEELEHQNISGELDEMMINHLLSKWAYAFPFHKVPNGFLFFRTLTSPTPSSKRPNIESLTLHSSGKRLCSTYSCPAVLHQYDQIYKGISARNFTSIWNTYLKKRGLENLLQRLY